MQLDFIGSTLNNSIPEQLSFGYKRQPILSKVERFFHSLKKDEINRHVDVWNELTPTKTEEIFQRYIFAFLSVHTSWESNVKAYEELKNWWTWFNKEDILLQKLKDCKVGLYNNRLKFLSSFSQDFWSNTSFYQKHDDESWVECRDRIEKVINGLGMAKSSFSLEMIYPMSANVTCLDTHLFQFYGLNQTKDARQYKTIEDHWCSWAKMFNLPAYIARCIYWNRNQGQENCLYWAKVFKA